MTGHESTFLKQHAPGPFKVTMPAASYVVARAYSPEAADPVYGSRAGLLKAVAEIINAEIKTLIDEGVPYIQLDNPHYPDYVVDDRRDQWRAIGIDPEQAMRDDVEADNACLAGLDRSDVTIGMHFCRGNGGRGGWHTRAATTASPRPCSAGSTSTRCCWSTTRSAPARFEPLRYVPSDKTVVLGLVTTKSGELESQELIERRIDEAAKYIDLDDLTLSPQCGFARRARATR